MRVQFELTLEEYCESQSYRFSKPAYYLFALTLVVALLFGGFGFLVYVAGPLLNRGFGLVLIGLALISFLVAPYAWIVAPRQSKKQDRKRFQTEYRLHFEGPREFEADNDGWRSISSRGEDRREWNAFYLFKETKSTFCLCTMADVYLLPKRAFSESDLSEFRRYIQSAAKRTVSVALCRTSYKVTRPDWISACACHNWKTHRLAMILFYSVWASLFAYFAVESYVGDDFTKSVYAWIVGFLIVAALSGEWLWYVFDFHQKKTHFSEVCVEIRREDILFDSAEGQYKIDYKRLERFEEARRVLLFYVTQESFFVLPKKAIDPKSMGAIREVLRQAIPFGLGRRLA